MGIDIGNNVYIANYCWCQGSGNIVIEDEVVIGPFCVLSTNNRTNVNGSYRFGPASRKPIIIKKGVWLGSHVVVTAGVCIGEGSKIGAGAVVTKDVPPGRTVVGIPGKVIN
jgi:maltose O-acetyltransferase